ncbi:hypothetical protein [Thermomonas sp.]|uniref:hypothetical protein n=1 Tax=Thermomonas sp. TaxID=1971895 RepID=UPI001ACDC516|nr:hypothetical protein [Xanthomonadales bacterium]MBN8767860.1 hypothetical protein [Stenotrophomonas sp.]
MLEANQFRENEAWVVFQLNDALIRTEQDGDFNCIALMDAASGFIFGTAFVPAALAEPSAFEVRKLFDSCLERSGGTPATLLLPRGQFDAVFPSEAKRRGIAAVHVHETELSALTSEATQGFREYVQGGRA